ncbi:MAG: hypothetical protein ACLFTK_07895 [Anaerolineales bacterium]
MEQWVIGTGALIGLSLGALAGFILEAVPLAVLVGLALGAALDYWRNRDIYEN